MPATGARWSPLPQRRRVQQVHRDGILQASSPALRLGSFVRSILPAWSLLLGLERGLDSSREFLRRTLRPEVEKHDARLLVRHVVVDRHDVDVRVTQRLEDILKLVLEHREVAIDYGGLRASSQR